MSEQRNRSAEFLAREKERQANTIDLIASENYVSKAVLNAIGSEFTNKYSEGEPGKRYYQGNEVVDDLENYLYSLVYEAFDISPDTYHVNAKGLSAAVANFATLTALLDLNDKIMSMYLYDGGHLSHGWDMPDKRGVTISSKMYDVQMYRVDKESHQIDYDKLEAEAKEFKPKMIITGGTAYPRVIDHARMRKICDEIGAYYFADCAHEAGLIVAGAFPSPFPHAHVVTFSTQKTLRGPRSSVIICEKDLGPKIDKALFPGLQGGPFDHHIFALTVAMEEALTDSFKAYGQQVVKNAKAMADRFTELGYTLVSGGTDKHLLSVDFRDDDKVRAKDLANALDKAGIVCNINTVPHDPRKPFDPSGVRFGAAAITTRKMGELQATEIVNLIHEVIQDPSDSTLEMVSARVKSLCEEFPIPEVHV